MAPREPSTKATTVSRWSASGVVSMEATTRRSYSSIRASIGAGCRGRRWPGGAAA